MFRSGLMSRDIACVACESLWRWLLGWGCYGGCGGRMRRCVDIDRWKRLPTCWEVEAVLR